ncbi:MAG: hypothetical protein K1X67_10265 [Fimbriimonadaceae bacterium]|nr:hypothetical protein [Fimbriimonadaceae bacterium]
MNRMLILASSTLALVLGSFYLTTRAESQPTAKGIVTLQPTTPGTPQTGHSNISGTSEAGQFVGGGAGLTGLNASNIASGTLADARLSSNVARLNVVQGFTGANTFTNPLNSFAGNGALLTNLNASNVTTGTLADTRLSTNVGLLSGIQTFTGAKTFSNTLNSFTGNGSGLTNIPWSGITGAPAFGQLGAANTWTAANTFSSTSNVFVGNGAGLYGIPANTLGGTPTYLAANQTWTGENQFPNPGNVFVGNGSGLTLLNASNIINGTLADTLLSSNVALLNRSQTFTSTNIFQSTTHFQGNVGIGVAAGSAPLSFSAGVGNKIGFGSGNGIAMASNSMQIFGAAIDFGYKPGGNNFISRMLLNSNGLTLAGELQTSTFKMTNGAAASTVLLGDSTGEATWGQVTFQQLASDPNSLEKVTGGNFSIVNGGMLGGWGNGITLQKGGASPGTTITLDPSSSTEAGLVFVRGYNGFANVVLTSTTSGNRGHAGVYDANGSTAAYMYVDDDSRGRIVAEAKNFVVPDPRDPEFNLVYACVEGPEAAMYTRGTGQLVNGRAVLELPDHFEVMAVMPSATVLVTPLGDCNGLFVTKADGQVTVKEFGGGRSNVAFDWEIKVVRKGYEDYKVREHWTVSRPEGDLAQQWHARLKTIAERQAKDQAKARVRGNNR